MKLILALQFHEADKPQAMRLARLIADIEPERREDVLFVFVARWDCAMDPNVGAYVCQKFNTDYAISISRLAGWPDGPNGMALTTLRYAARRCETSPLFAPNNDWLGLLMIEPDCVPVHRDWLNILIAEWTRQRAAGKWLMGAWRNSGGPYGHINGNCVTRPDFATLVDLSVPQGLAWDCAIAPQVKDHWEDTPLIANYFQSMNATEKVLDDGAVLVHGFKDDSMYELARRTLGL